MSYLDHEQTRDTFRINTPGRAINMDIEHTKAAMEMSDDYDDMVYIYSESRVLINCLAQSLNLTRGQSLSDVCGGTAAGKPGCAWEEVVTELREAAWHGSASVDEFMRSCYPAAYILSCHVGGHKDGRVASEFIAERWSPRMSTLNPSGCAHARATASDGRGRVIAPELGLRFHLRTARDIAHLAFHKVAHFSPVLSLEEQIIGDAGGGVVKYVGS